MPDPQGDEGSPPRKRIAVAVSPTPRRVSLESLDIAKCLSSKTLRCFSLSWVLFTQAMHHYTTYIHTKKQVFMPRTLLIMTPIIVWTMPQA